MQTYIFACSICIYGGGNRRQQIDIVTRGVEIVIGETFCDFFKILYHIGKITSIPYITFGGVGKTSDNASTCVYVMYLTVNISGFAVFLLFSYCPLLYSPHQHPLHIPLLSQPLQVDLMIC